MNKSSNQPIKKLKLPLRFGIIARIAVGFIIVTALLLLITALSMFNSQKVENQFNQLANVTTPYAEDSQRLSQNFLVLETQMRLIAAAKNLEDMQKFNELRNATSEQILIDIESLKSKSLNQPQNLENIENIFTQLESLQTIANNIVIARSNNLEVELLTQEITAELESFTNLFEPMFDELLFDLENWRETEVILFEVKSIVISGLLYVEQIKSSNNKRDIQDISGGKLITWMSDIIPVAIKLKNKENNEQTDQFVKEVFAITEKVLEKVRGLGGPQDANFAPGLTQQKVRGITLNEEIEQHLIDYNNSVQLISGSISLLVQSSKKQSKQIEQSVKQQFEQSRLVMIVISLIGLMIAILISTIITLTFKKSLRQLKEILGNLAQGDLTSKLKNPKNDEMGDLERYIATVSQSLKELIGDIQHTFEQVEHSVQNSRTLSKQTREHVVTQKEQLESVSSALSDMNTTSAEVAKYAEQTHEQVEHADEYAIQGTQKVSNNQASIQSVSDHFSQTQETIVELDSGVHQIEGILQTIGSIAEQTNLLALNAAIEAARAGEQGRGFAVVADEVRSLANRTQQSTAEIQAMTGKMINGSKQAVQMMKESNLRINKSLDLAQEANDTISEFKGIMDGIRNISHLIATAAEEQSLVSNEVSGNIKHVAELAEQTEHAAIESTDSAKQLKQLSHVLTQKLGKFKVE
ncbi:methyl-accepting chemotaxis protein [Marinicellulosiphila megalodicopiae]|uniref:methyl-accepting chemotaxis protein n=1 Tax=Marinicellulosiphila megalodicopiae TaxID=2724896 RepID=UPI003BAFCE1A